MFRKDKLYRELANLVRVYRKPDKFDKERCSTNSTRINKLVIEHMPQGSGFDSGTKLNIDKSTEELLVFETAFHHMNEHGAYDMWTDHTVTVRASLLYELDLKISGKNRNDIKEYIHETFVFCLLKEV